MSLLKALILFKKGMTLLLEFAVIVLMATLVADVLWGVLTRTSGTFVAWLETKDILIGSWLPKGQAKWSEEIATNLLMWVSLLGACVAYNSKAHLGVDYFVSKLHDSTRPLVTIVVNVLVGLFSVIVMLVGGYILVSDTFRSGQLSAALEIPQGYYYLAVPISGIFMILYCIENIIEAVVGLCTPGLTEARQIAPENS